jgi:hypothetical protein
MPGFDWDTHWFICHQVKDKNKTGRKFSLVDMNPESMRANVLKAAKERKDEVIINRMTFDRLFEVNAWYYADCLAKYLNVKNIEVCKKAQTVSQYDRAAVETLDFFADAIEAGKIVLTCSQLLRKIQRISHF